MKVYWKENGDKIGEDDYGNSIYERITHSGELVGTAYNSRSGYPNLVIALENGKFITKLSCDCRHIEF